MSALATIGLATTAFASAGTASSATALGRPARHANHISNADVSRPRAARPATQARTVPLRQAPLGPAAGLQTSSHSNVAGIWPDQMRTAYNLGPLTAKGIEGRGQTIVIVDSFGSPTIARDLTAFDHFFSLPAPPSFRVIQPVGKVPSFGHRGAYATAWAFETSLDVEWAHAMAPDAGIVLVETPTSENEGTSGFPQIVAAEKYVLKHNLGQVISQSFAATEQTFSSKTALLRLRGAYTLALRDHVTVVAGTGDNGATGSTYNMRSFYSTRAVSWPATDPLVTAVGGTQLDLRANGSRSKPDVAWNDSGGGRSIVFRRPSYQQGVRQLTGDHRGVPDISMDASCNSTAAVYESFPGTFGDNWSTACGTSLATPLFAGIVALADQVAGHGKPRGLGLINPAIYRMQDSHDKGIVDIRKGKNSFSFVRHGVQHTVPGFTARKGYDLVSGVGTVNAAYFVPELAKLAG